MAVAVGRLIVSPRLVGSRGFEDGAEPAGRQVFLNLLLQFSDTSLRERLLQDD